MCWMILCLIYGNFAVIGRVYTTRVPRRNSLKKVFNCSLEWVYNPRSRRLDACRRTINLWHTVTWQAFHVYRLELQTLHNGVISHAVDRNWKSCRTNVGTGHRLWAVLPLWCARRPAWNSKASSDTPSRHTTWGLHLFGNNCGTRQLKHNSRKTTLWLPHLHNPTRNIKTAPEIWNVYSSRRMILYSSSITALFPGWDAKYAPIAFRPLPT